MLAFFKKWTDRFTKTPASSRSLIQQDAHTWKQILLQEQERLGGELTELLASYERSLNYFVAHINDLDEATLQREYKNLESIRSVLGNAIRRLEVSTKDDRELANEWQEWQAVRETAKRALEQHQDQRVEMVRSELALRGLLKADALEEDSQKPVSVLEEVERVSRLPQPTHRRVVFVEDQRDDLEDWNALHTKQLEQATLFWQHQLDHAFSLAERDPQYAAAVISRFRAVQAKKKQRA